MPLKSSHRVGLLIILIAGALFASPLSAAAAPRLLASTPLRVGCYQKIEFTIDLPTTYTNPYDPEEVDLSLAIEGPSGKTVSLPAFYMQPYEYRQIGGTKQRDWFYPAGAAGWKARFAPREVGSYRCRAILVSKKGTGAAREESGTVTFECVKSDQKGFVRVARGNPRYFEYGEGGTFFPIGQNLAFIGDSQYVSVTKARAIFGKMGENGANFARIWTCCGDWAMGIETRKKRLGAVVGKEIEARRCDGER